MNNRTKNFTIPAMMYGIYIAVPTILITLICYFTDNFFSSTNSLLPLLILITAIIKGSIDLREHLGGQLSYGRALGFGTLISFYGSVIVGLVHYLIFHFDPELLNLAKDLSEEAMMLMESLYKGNEDLFEEMIDEIRKNTSAQSMWVGQVSNLTLYGFLFSLVISIFTKKSNNNPFAEIEDEE